MYVYACVYACAHVCICVHICIIMYLKLRGLQKTLFLYPFLPSSLSPSFLFIKTIMGSHFCLSLPMCGVFFYFTTGQNPLSSPITCLALVFVCPGTDSCPPINDMLPFLLAIWKLWNGCHYPHIYSIGHSYSYCHHFNWDLCLPMLHMLNWIV